MSIYSDSYWNRREEQDEGRPGGGRDVFNVLGDDKPELPELDAVDDSMGAPPPESYTASPKVETAQVYAKALGDKVERDPLAGKPMFGPVEPPPPMPADVAPSPEAPPDFAPYAPTQPKPEADDGSKALRMRAIREMQRLADAPQAGVGGPSDEEIRAAMQRDRQAVQRANLSEAIAAAFARRPARLQQEPSEADDLLRMRQMAQHRGGDRATAFSLNERLAAALKEPKPADESLAGWRLAQIERLGALGERDRAEAEAKKKKGETADTAAEAERASLENERQLLLKDPRAKAFGLTPDVIGKLDRKGLHDVRQQIESMKPPKGGGGTGQKVNIKAGDIDSVPERRAGYRSLIKAIAEGRMEAPKAGSKREAAEVVSDVLAYKPDFDATRFGTYKDVAGKSYGDVTITNALTAKKHFARALENVPKNFEAHGLNRILNAIKTGSGSAGMTQFETDVAIGAGELAKGLGENAEAGKERVLHMLESAQSPEQLKARLNELIYLQEEALETKRERFESAAPKGTALPGVLKREEKPGAALKPGMVNVRRKSDGVVAPVTAEQARRLIAKGTYEPE